MSRVARAATPEQKERRALKRETMVLRVGLLESGGKSSFCLVKNISAAGVQVKIYGHISPDCPVSLKVGDESPLEGKVVWIHDQLGGIEFNTPLDPTTLLRVTQKLASTKRRSSPRVNAAVRALLRTGGHTFTAELCDISTSGAKVRTRKVIQPGPWVLLDLPGMPTIRAHVRWADEHELGLSFDAAIPIQIIAGWVNERLQVSS